MKTTNERIDHAEEAVTWLENAKRAQASSEPYNEQLATAYAGIAQGHATLALVEQQRIANRIALGEQWEDTGNPALDSVAPQLRPEIEEALGL